MLPPSDDRPAPPSVTRVRFGLATNSSSSHSLVLLLEPEAEEDTTEGSYASDFVLVTREAKRHYLAATLVSDVGGLYGRDLPSEDRMGLNRRRSFGKDDPCPPDPALLDWWERVERHVAGLCGLPEGTDLLYYDVDHQSLMRFPRAADGWGPDPEAFARYRDLLLEDDVAVFGGWDAPHPRWNEDRHLLLGSTDLSVERPFQGEG